MPDHAAARARLRAAVPAAAFAAAVLAGGLLRAAAGGGLLSSNLVYSAPVRQAAPGSSTPADAVRSFYLSLDRGEYAAAWGLSREPDYTGSGNALYRSAVTGEGAARRGWTSREAFVSRLTDELGHGGVWLRLADVQTAEVAGASGPEDPGEVVAKAGGSGGSKAAAVVRAEGTLLGACTIFHWEKVLPVAREREGWRVLLPGTKQANSLFYQEWFANVRKVGTLRAAAP